MHGTDLDLLARTFIMEGTRFIGQGTGDDIGGARHKALCELVRVSDHFR